MTADCVCIVSVYFKDLAAGSVFLRDWRLLETGIYSITE